MKWRLGILTMQCILCALIPGVCAADALPLPPGRYVQHISFRGYDRTFILRIPRSVNVSRPAPLVVVLHGWTSSAAGAEVYTNMGALAESAGFIAVFPQGLGNPAGWNADFMDLSGARQDDVEFVESVIDKVETDSWIDPDRVFVCGHSNGAFLSEAVGARLGARIAAIGIVAGTIGVPGRSGSPARLIRKPGSPVSVIAIHGRLDPMVSYDDSAQAVLRGISAPESAKWWAKADGCNPVPTITKSPDGNVETSLYSGGRDGVEVELVSLKRGVHTWPGGQTPKGRETASELDAAQTLWDFFVRHPKRNAN